VVAVASIYCQCLPEGTGKLSQLGVLQARHFMRNFFSDPYDAKDSKKTTVKKISSNITKTVFIYKTKVLATQIEVGALCVFR
jgi:hypothetical protein